MTNLNFPNCKELYLFKLTKPVP